MVEDLIHGIINLMYTYMLELYTHFYVKLYYITYISSSSHPGNIKREYTDLFLINYLYKHEKY